MGMLDWTEKSSAVLQQGGVIGPHERLPWPLTTVMGVQHVIAAGELAGRFAVIAGDYTRIAVGGAPGLTGIFEDGVDEPKAPSRAVRSW